MARPNDTPNGMTVNAKITAVALVGGAAAVKIANANPDRKLLTVMNTGLGGPLTFGFTSTLTLGTGLNLDAANSTNGQGGFYEFKDTIPMNEIWALCGANTTISVMEAS